MQSSIFSIFPVSSVSQDPPEIIVICWFAAQKHLLSMLKTDVLLHIFVDIFSAFLDEEVKRMALFLNINYL